MFDFWFYQDALLVHQYKNIPYKDETYITENITYDHKRKMLFRETEELNIKIDINNHKLHIKLKNKTFEGDTSLIQSEVTENHNNITIRYQIDRNEPIYKIVIIRRKNER